MDTAVFLNDRVHVHGTNRPNMVFTTWRVEIDFELRPVLVVQQKHGINILIGYYLSQDCFSVCVFFKFKFGFALLLVLVTSRQTQKTCSLSGANPHSQGGGGDEGACPLVVVDRHGAGGQGFAVTILRAGVGARARAKSLEVSEFKFV